MQKSPGQPGGQAAMEQNEKATVSTGARTQRLYNVAEIGTRFDKLRASAMKPLDATVYDLRDRLIACLREGYTIADVVAMLREAGIDGTDRQIRYALHKAGIGRNGKKKGTCPSSRRQQPTQANDSTTDTSDTDAPAIADNGGAMPDSAFATTETQPEQNSTTTETKFDTKAPTKRQHASSPSNTAPTASGMTPEQALTPENEAEQYDHISSDNDLQTDNTSGWTHEQASTHDPQALHPVWTPRSGALNALADADTRKLNKYRELNERRWRK